MGRATTFDGGEQRERKAKPKRVPKTSPNARTRQKTKRGLLVRRLSLSAKRRLPRWKTPRIRLPCSTAGNAEAGDRARAARRQAMSLDNGTNGSQVNEDRRREAQSLQQLAGQTLGTTGREVQGAYQGREAEHRQIRAANLAEIEASKQADDLMKARSSARMKNASADALLDADMKVASSNTRGVPRLLSPEDRDIPQGVHETSYDIQNGLVIMRDCATAMWSALPKVVMKTGTYYFCGDHHHRPVGIWKPTSRTIDNVVDAKSHHGPVGARGRLVGLVGLACQ